MPVIEHENTNNEKYGLQYKSKKLSAH